MAWREDVMRLEDEGNFDIAVFLLEKVIKENPNEMDAYIFLLYRFMDSFLENTCYWSYSKDPLREIKKEYYEAKLWSEYTKRAQKCFDESYARFSENIEYCYYASRILLPSSCFIGLEVQESLLEAMYQKAREAGYNKDIDTGRSSDMDEMFWAQKIVHDASVVHQLATKGYAGQYMVGWIFTRAKEILEKAEMV